MDDKVLRKILEISRRMAETRKATQLFHYFMGEAMNLVKAQYGYLVLLNDDGTLDFRVTRDRQGDELDDAEEQISHTILTQVINEGEPVSVLDASNDPNFAKSTSVNELKLRSVICVPLVSRGSVIGAVYVENRSSAIFKKADLAPLIILANQAAVLIENAVLNRELETKVMERTAELNLALKRLEHGWLEMVEANQIRTSFLANLTHDMRVPLSVAMGAASILESETTGYLNDDQKNWAGKIIEALRFVSELTDDLFNLTRYTDNQNKEFHQLAFITEITETEVFLNQLYEIGKALPWEKDVEFLLDLEPELPFVKIDPIRIRQVIFNLLSNALKFTKQGNVTLYAHLSENQKSVVIGIKDTGRGVPADVIETVFVRFHQHDSDPIRQRTGAGLGLAICKELVAMHDGTIWVESVIGEGADFKFSLPTVPLVT